MKSLWKNSVAVLTILSILPFSQAAVHAEQKHSESITASQVDVQTKKLSIEKESTLSAAERAFVGKVKAKKGVHRQGDLYVVSRGEVPTSGYGLKVVGTEQGWEMLTVYVELTNPAPEDITMPAVHTPYIIVRASLPPYTTMVFMDAKTDKVLFQ
ncbi:protease complex subunit PrcB family protein [Brevibacillus sp. M2.1A]|uniref:protease complex subunit PrcB family protein n=1 Tax=Brevibacillus TaxID=55080 RepID=UPI00156B124D|nr:MULTISPECIES: protease complex subunit PrcB family protein [Brevibacillus]MBY0087314.1 protease complex subunit PrcB family protein [Brevibacillus brevis]MCC8437060.1 protease complex subunit PrcB family protein [Brevibacillus sp. M2.1A]MCE0449651.1 protease complex subunit PrcB family protein [Brevibacillus sp. AF8]MCM3143205.1 protease complex subunit PrcB family protein [Brevibacillus sp. MER 51]UKK99217.1 protease complex subunit PrcB family protein [Brevibacillus brevis]